MGIFSVVATLMLGLTCLSKTVNFLAYNTVNKAVSENCLFLLYQYQSSMLHLSASSIN